MLRKFPQILRYALAGEKGLFLVRVTPEVVSLLDYRKGFGHTDLVKLCVANSEFQRFAGEAGAAWRRGREPAPIPPCRASAIVSAWGKSFFYPSSRPDVFGGIKLASWPSALSVRLSGTAPQMKFVATKSADQLDEQALHHIRKRFC